MCPLLSSLSGDQARCAALRFLLTGLPPRVSPITGLPPPCPPEAVLPRCARSCPSVPGNQARCASRVPRRSPAPSVPHPRGLRPNVPQAHLACSCPVCPSVPGANNPRGSPDGGSAPVCPRKGAAPRCARSPCSGEQALCARGSPTGSAPEGAAPRCARSCPVCSETRLHCALGSPTGGSAPLAVPRRAPPPCPPEGRRTSLRSVLSVCSGNRTAALAVSPRAPPRGEPEGAAPPRSCPSVRNQARCARGFHGGSAPCPRKALHLALGRCACCALGARLVLAAGRGARAAGRHTACLCPGFGF